MEFGERDGDVVAKAFFSFGELDRFGVFLEEAVAVVDGQCALALGVGEKFEGVFSGWQLMDAEVSTVVGSDVAEEAIVALRFCESFPSSVRVADEGLDFCLGDG